MAKKFFKKLLKGLCYVPRVLITDKLKSYSRRYQVLVVGGGPAGCAAAASAAQMGAETLLVERYGHLGGMSTGGFVVWIDRVTDWSGQQVITGFTSELLDRFTQGGRAGTAGGAVGRDGPAGCRLLERAP